MSKARDLSNIPAGGYDVNFYEDTGTTPKFFWDASAESLGIGTSIPTGKLTISESAGTNAPTSIVADNVYLQLGSEEYGASNNGKFMIGFGYTDGTANTHSPAYMGYEESSTSGDTYGSLTFYTRNVTTDTAPTERMRITSDGDLRFNSGYGSVATAYGCRAWANAQQVGTQSIRGSGGISSITDLATGQTRFNLSATMPDANYSVSFFTNAYGSTGSPGDFGNHFAGNVWNKTTTSFSVASYMGTAYVDAATVDVAVFR